MQGSVPVHEVEVSVQVARIHSTFAQLQLGLGVVVHVVHTHLFQDAKAPLQHRHKTGLALPCQDCTGRVLQRQK